jgi:hypothetical protein
MLRRHGEGKEMDTFSRIRSRALGVSSIATMLLVACSSTPPPQTSTQVQTPAQVQADQVPIPTTASEVRGPAAGPMTKSYVQTVGRMAYAEKEMLLQKKLKQLEAETPQKN